MKARRSALAALLAAFAAAAYGCSSATTTSTSTDVATTVVADARMSIVSPSDAACFPVPDGPEAMIPLTLAFTDAAGNPANVFLRAAGFCTSIPNSLCGHIVVKVNGLVNNEGVTRTVNALLGKFATPYQDFAITVELVGDDGRTLLIAGPNDAGVIDFGAGKSLEASITVQARKSCDGSTSSSSASGSSSASSGGGGMGGSTASSSSSGAGGMGGSSSDAGDGG